MKMNIELELSAKQMAILEKVVADEVRVLKYWKNRVRRLEERVTLLDSPPGVS